MRGQWIAMSKDPTKTKKDQWLSDLKTEETLDQLKQRMLKEGEDVNMFIFKDPPAEQDKSEDELLVYVKAIFALFAIKKYGKNELCEMAIKKAMTLIRGKIDVSSQSQTPLNLEEVES